MVAVGYIRGVAEQFWLVHVPRSLNEKKTTTKNEKTHLNIMAIVGTGASAMAIVITCARFCVDRLRSFGSTGRWCFRPLKSFVQY